MENEAILSILDNAFVICLILAIACLLLTVVLFFVLHIRDTIYELSGRARKDATKKMEENYAFTGSLRTSETASGTSGEMQAQQTKKKHDSGGLHLTDKLPKEKQSELRPNDTAALNRQPPAGTAPLNRQPPAGTAPLNRQPPAETTAPNRTAPAATGTMNRTAAAGGKGVLKLSKNIMLIHTNEIIQ